MTLTGSILADDRKAQQRRDFLDGLRELADFLEAHPGLPVPGAQNHSVYVFTKEQLAAAAREPGVRWQKNGSGDYFKLTVTFSGEQSYEVFTERAEVCRKVVTGKRTLPARPEQDVETYEWVCDEPLLVGAK